MIATGSAAPSTDVRLGEPKSLSSLAAEVGLADSEVYQLLAKASRDHFRMYGTRPFELLYDPENGEMLRANSTIGHVGTEKFLVRLLPAVEGLDIAKCIGLAQACGFGFLSRYNDEIIRQKLSEREEYTAVDFFARSLLAVTTVVLRNGLDRRLARKSSESFSLAGNIDFQTTVSTGKPLKPTVEDVVIDHNTPPNRLLATALTVCKDQCKSRQVGGWASNLLSQLTGVYPYKSTEEIEMVPASYFSVPRADYVQALLLANLILKGISWEPGSASSFLPLFTLDLDKLFEKYVSKTLFHLLDPNKFTVAIQKEVLHQTRPPFGEKYFVPDLIISGANKPTHVVIMDLKNKYSSVAKDEKRYASNQDIFQIAYYCHAMKTKFAFLVYPGTKKVATQYPLKASESQKSYDERRARAEKTILGENQVRLFDQYPKVELVLFKWILNMGGTLHDTRSSVASLAKFVVDLETGVCNVP
jgi:5-methylcytosine-specific restriction endonuclease McrBC regulatory subunit McrC